MTLAVRRLQRRMTGDVGSRFAGRYRAAFDRTVQRLDRAVSMAEAMAKRFADMIRYLARDDICWSARSWSVVGKCSLVRDCPSDAVIRGHHALIATAVRSVDSRVSVPFFSPPDSERSFAEAAARRSSEPQRQFATHELADSSSPSGGAAADCGGAGPGGGVAGQAPRRPRPTRHPHPSPLPRPLRRPCQNPKGGRSRTIGDIAIRDGSSGRPFGAASMASSWTKALRCSASTSRIE